MSETIGQENDLRKTIEKCLNLNNPKSFFLYAGAGTGKTRAVVEALDIFRNRHGALFRQSGQKVAVITYTNAARDEIRHRIDFDPIFAVSTIHSFAWELIRTHRVDISAWLHKRLTSEIAELQKKLISGRPGTKVAAERKVQLESKNRRLQNLDAVRKFTYNPNGDNVGKDSLNHTEVIAILAELLFEKPLLRKILIRKHPVLLIDESQDTQKDLIDAFFDLQAEYPDQFILCLFGDTMQRIYSDGKVGLENIVPEDWEKPSLDINYRCPKRIVKLLNKIRSETDKYLQVPRPDVQEGLVRLFLICDADDKTKSDVEMEVATKMAQATADNEWLCQQSFKILTLEHHMAARRGGFDSFFEPLHRINKFKTGLLDGKLSGIAFFRQQVLPLIYALKSNDSFAVARIIKNNSKIVSQEEMRRGTDSLEKIRTARCAVEFLFSQWNNDADPLLLDILKVIKLKNIFHIPDVFAPILADIDVQEEELITEDADDDKNPEVDAWREALSVPFSQFEAYVDYISERSVFGTHQGIKGLQFPRVMVILNDSEARGFMFSYDKLLGAKPPTEIDKKNLLEGKDTSMDRTRRLFYVTCSRAQKSLALIVYTKEVNKVFNHITSNGWFDRQEIVRI